MRSLFREFLETLLLSLAVYLALQFSVQPYRVEGSSMLPRLSGGEYLLVNKITYAKAPLIGGDDGYVFNAPARGEVVIFRYPLNPSRNFVKRVIGVPGDTVEIVRGEVMLNGTALDEPYITRPDSSSMSALSVPEDTYFVLGDNRRASDDSRSWGVVPADNIIGRAWVSYWPPAHLRSLLALP